MALGPISELDVCTKPTSLCRWTSCSAAADWVISSRAPYKLSGETALLILCINPLNMRSKAGNMLVLSFLHQTMKCYVINYQYIISNSQLNFLESYTGLCIMLSILLYVLLSCPVAKPQNIHYCIAKKFKTHGSLLCGSRN